MKNKLRLTYFAISENYGENHAGFTHSYNITKNLGLFCKSINVFFSDKKLGLIKKEGNVYFHGIQFPKYKNIFNLVHYIMSYFYTRKIIKNSDIINERFHINPIDLILIRNKPYILEMNDPSMVLHKSFIYRFFIKLKLKKCICVITQTE